MRLAIRVSIVASAVGLMAACAESPSAPSVAPELGKSSPGAASGGSTASTAGWTLVKQVEAIIGGTSENMIPEWPTTPATPPITRVDIGQVKWIEYAITAKPVGPSSSPTATVEEGLRLACQNIWPLFQCTWSDNLGAFKFSGNGGTVHVMIDMHNMFACGETLPFTNTATLTDAAGRKVTSSATLTFTPAVCKPTKSCTLTQGYWKQRKHAWPAHPLFPGTTLRDWPFASSWFFFGGDKHWQDVLETPPKGDAYYILAHQYIAAVLNQANGAPPVPSVQSTLEKAYLYFSKQATASRTDLTAWADLLAKYNEGKLGVRHCGKSDGKDYGEDS
jgi:hypothetical protein